MDDDAEPTPFERELNEADTAEGRGHTPADGVTEPTVAPPDPASASPAAAALRDLLPPPPPEDPPQQVDGE